MVAGGEPLTLAPLVIVGPTASGKSALAVELACRHSGTEVVSADSMAVYRTMDIGTAKPTAAERTQIPHHGIDVADPSEEFTVADFQALATTAIESAEQRGCGVIVAGGTGLYVRAVVDQFTVPPRFPDVRAELEADPDTEALWTRLSKLDPAAANKMLPTNRRRIIRALEVTVGAQRPFSSFGPGVDAYPPTRFKLAGIDIGRDDMDRRIDQRYDHQMSSGMLSEVADVAERGMSRTARQALGYRELLAHLDGQMALDDALAEAKRRTRRFARRQQRWFRRDPRITWFSWADDDLVDQIDAWWASSPQPDLPGGNAGQEDLH